jgi:hypothetical protein
MTAPRIPRDRRAALRETLTQIVIRYFAEQIV